jgi:hypothetical protein
LAFFQVDPDVLQSIQALPGVESTNESIANINVRGGTNDQNLMLWDNIKDVPLRALF